LYTKELEDLQAKHQQALRAAEKYQDELNAARARADALLQVAECELANLTDELARSVAEVERQSAVNEKQRDRHDRLRKEVDGLRVASAKYDAELLEKTNAVIEIKQKVADVKRKLAVEQEQLRARETDMAQNIEQLRGQVRAAEEQLPPALLDETGTSPMNESEIRESVEALEREHASLTAEVEDLGVQFDRSESTRMKIEAAMDLITEMDDEEAFMTNELKMLRTQFAATIKMLTAHKKK
jgi:chromosome segregation ATPase